MTGFGSAVSFDGVNDELRSDANFDTQSITIEAWVQVRSFGPAGFGGLAAWGRNSDAAWEVALGIDGRVTFACNWNKSNYPISSIPGIFTPNEWTHVAVTYDGAVARFYSNGELLALAQFDVPISLGGSGAYLGLNNQFPGNDEFLAGSFDELRVWSVVRTAEEIRCTMNRPLVGTEPGLMVAYGFNEAGGQAVLDGSPNGRNAYLGALSTDDAADPVREASGAVYQCISQLTPTSIERVCPVQAASMVADVCATGAITYQWQRRGGLGSATDWVDVVEGSNSAQGQFLLNAVGATARSLRVDSGMVRWPFAAEIPSYEFRCVATASCGSLTTNVAAMIVCPADVNCDGVVDGDDVIVYFGAWDTGELIADFTGDDSVDGDDVIAFFARWDTGC